MIRLALLSLIPLAACRASGALPDAPPLESVAEFEVDRYLGKWYEISKYPVSFEKGLLAVTATYSKRDDGKIRVENAGFKGEFNGKRKTATAKAWVPDPDRPAELKVSFFWPFTGNYWVIALDRDYQWAIVGEPSRKYLWILARQPEISDALYRRLVKRVEDLGYDASRLEIMPQVAAQE